MTTALNRYVDWLCEQYRVPPKPLGLVRILFALQLLIFMPDQRWVADVPDEFFQPVPGPFQFMTGPPPAALVDAIHWMVVVLTVVVLVGWKTRTASVALTLGLVTLSGFAYSYGKVDHFILVEIFPAVMAAAGWGRAYSIDARTGDKRDTNGLPMLAWAGVMAYAFLTAGIPKMLTGWADPARQATRGYVASDLVDGQKIGPLAEQIMRIHSDFVWKALDYATLFAESWMIVAVLVPVFFRLGIVLLLGFHVGVYLTLGIDFSRYVLVEGVFLVPWFVHMSGWVRGRRGDSAPAPGDNQEARATATATSHSGSS